MDELMEYLDDLTERAELYFSGEYKDGWLAAVSRLREHFKTIEGE